MWGRRPWASRHMPGVLLGVCMFADGHLQILHVRAFGVGLEYSLEGAMARPEDCFRSCHLSPCPAPQSQTAATQVSHHVQSPSLVSLVGSRIKSGAAMFLRIMLAPGEAKQSVETSSSGCSKRPERALHPMGSESAYHELPKTRSHKVGPHWVFGCG